MQDDFKEIEACFSNTICTKYLLDILTRERKLGSNLDTKEEVIYLGAKKEIKSPVSISLAELLPCDNNFSLGTLGKGKCFRVSTELTEEEKKDIFAEVVRQNTL